MPAYLRQGLTGLALLLPLMVLSGCNGTLSPDYGPREGKFPPCPVNQDCASSQETDPKLFIAPLHYKPSHNSAQADRDQAHADLIAAINAAGPARIVSNHRHYVRVEYPAANHDQRSGDYYYQPEQAVDEAQFYLSPNNYTIEMFSVGKLGLLQNGDNRERLERVRAYFDKLQEQPHD